MRGLLFVLTLFLFLACNHEAKHTTTTDSTKNSTQAKDSNTIAVEQQPDDKQQFYIWEVDAAKKTKTRNLAFLPQYNNVDTLLIALNERYPQVRLEKTHIGHDTLYTEIKNADYLTEQMGSAGSEQYIAQAVINLTSVPGINFLRIDFAEGNHASPDVWSKQSFADYKEQ